MPTIDFGIDMERRGARGHLNLDGCGSCLRAAFQLRHHRRRQAVLVLVLPNMVNGRTDISYSNPEITPSEFPVSNWKKWGWMLILDDWKFV